MSERIAAPAADNFDEFDDADLGMTLDDVPAQSLDDVLDEIHKDDDPDPMGGAFDGDDQDDEEHAPIAPPMSEQLTRPIGEILSAIALQGISAHAKKRPLSALDDEKIVAMYRRLASLLETQEDATEAEAWRSDVRILEAAAATREINLLALPEAELSNEALGRIARGVEKTTAAPGDLAGTIFMVAIDAIEPDPAQARDEGADDELADSIKANGFYESKPIELRRTPAPHARPYMIVDGERRWRGAAKAGLHLVPAIVTDAAEDEGARLLRQVVSNEGKRLKPMEEARTYQRIMAAKGWNLQQLADHLGKSKSTVGDRVAMAEAPAAFQPLFVEGTLTAAAAPIVRQLRDLPPKIVEDMLEYASQGSDWERAVNDGKAVPLVTLERELVEAAQQQSSLFQLRKDDKGVGDCYDGPVITIGKTRFAADMNRVRLLQAHRETTKASAPAGAKAAAAPVPKPAPSTYQIAERKRAKAAKAKGLLRRAQLAALSPRLPTELDAKWAGFLVRHLIRETTNDTRREACKLLNIEPPKQGQHSGYSFDKALEKHAATLKGPELIRFALQILISSDLAVSTYGSSDAKRLGEAASLAKFDLKKVKVDDDREFPAGAAAKAKSAAVKKAAKPAKKRQPNAAFMKPYPLTPALEAVIGKGPMMRTELTKKIWGYIKRNGLQDKKERRLINADDKLKLIFKGKKQVSMFEMTKLLNNHIVGYKA